MATYQQVLEQMKTAIEASAMSAEDKKTALQRLADFLGSPGVVGIAGPATGIPRRE